MDDMRRSPTLPLGVHKALGWGYYRVKLKTRYRGEWGQTYSEAGTLRNLIVTGPGSYMHHQKRKKEKEREPHDLIRSDDGWRKCRKTCFMRLLGHFGCEEDGTPVDVATLDLGWDDVRCWRGTMIMNDADLSVVTTLLS
jgi:hypothetical protein